MKNIEDLETWKLAREFRKKISIIAKQFPKIEQYRLSDQIIRSSRSVTANIAEGNGRYYFKENIQFCRKARGSLVETLDHLICANDEDYISDAELKQFRAMYGQCLKLLNGYISYLKNRKNEDIE